MQLGERLVARPLRGHVSLNPEEKQKPMTPSELATAEFLKRVGADSDLPEEIKAAVVKDAEGSALAALTNLKAALSDKDSSNAA